MHANHQFTKLHVHFLEAHLLTSSMYIVSCRFSRERGKIGLKG